MYKPQLQNSNQSRTLKSSGNSASSSNSMRSMSGVPMLNGNAVASQLKINSNSAKSQNSQESFDEVDDGPVPEGLAKCSICKRNFAEDRLAKHQTICQKTKSKKRKVYDASKKRVQVRSKAFMCFFFWTFISIFIRELRLKVI